MATPARPASTAASVPGGCVGYQCASGPDVGPLHHVYHEGVFLRLCSSCVLVYHPAAFCSVCLLLLALEPVGDPRVDGTLAFPSPTVACSDCRLSLAHVSCLEGDHPYCFVCPPCAAANEGRIFSVPLFMPSGADGRHVLDERSAQVLLVAGRLTRESAGRAAVAARELVERSMAEAVAARKVAREMLDAAKHAVEALAQEQQQQRAPPKKKIPKSNNEADKLRVLKAMHQTALAFAGPAPASATMTWLRTPSSSKQEKKQDAKGKGKANIQ